MGVFLALVAVHTMAVVVTVHLLIAIGLDFGVTICVPVGRCHVASGVQGLSSESIVTVIVVVVDAYDPISGIMVMIFMSLN